MREQLGRVLASNYDDDGFLCVQIETVSGALWFELSNPHGFQSRPLDPDDKGSCQAYYWYEGSRGYARLANDPRTQSLLPESQKGEAFFHGPSGAFVRFKSDGSISLFTTHDNTTNGRSVYLTVAPTGLEFSFPYGKLTFDANGFHVVHSSGARLDLGAIAAPAPLDALSSYATLSAAMTHIDGSAIHVGSSSGAPQPVALATATLALCAALKSVLDAIGTPGGLTAPNGPCGPGPALEAALATATVALAHAQEAVPSVSSTATGFFP